MSYSSEVLADSPLVYWHLDESSGTSAADSSGNSRTGTYSGSPTLGGAGQVGNAPALNGTSQYVSVANASWMNITSFSVEAWFKTSSTADKAIAGRAQNAHFMLYNSSTQGITFTVYRSTTAMNRNAGGVSHSDGNWHHVVGTWDNATSTSTLYIDGVAQTTLTQAGSGSLVTSTDSMYVGRRGGGTPLYWSGSVDEYAFYTGVLSPTRIAAHYAAATAIDLTSPTATATAAANPGTLAFGALALTSPIASATADANPGTLAFGLTSPAAAATADAAPASLAFGALSLTSPEASATAAAEPASANVGGAVLTSPEAVATAASSAGTLAFSALALTSPAATATADANPATIDIGTISADIKAPVVIGAGIVSSESSETPADSPILTAPIVYGARFRSPLTPVPPPVGVLVEWPLERQAHIMPALSAANPRYRAELDYDVEYDTIGRTHVFVDGEDYTYKRGVPAQFDDYTSSMPMHSASASIKLPQFKPWDESGEGDWAALDMSRDPSVEIAIVRPDDSVEQVWEGFMSSEEDSSGQGREDYTFKAEGMFLQAAHQLWDPPVYMEPTDPGHLIADALNAVVHRRWNAIPRFDTGLPKVIERGEQGQTVWQYVQDLLSKAWTEDERQLTLQRIAPYTYRLDWKKAADDVDWTVTKGAPGIECNLRTDQSNRRDALYGRGVADDGGVWGNFYFPGLDLYAIPRYPFDDVSTNVDVGTTDADTDTGNGVTLWQRRMRELGYNVALDGVMNSADTYWVRKVQTDRGVTVDGSLGPQTWNATFDRGMTVLDLTRIRRPLSTRDDVEPYLYNANGAKIGKNPNDDPKKIRHAAPEVDFGAGWRKTAAFPVAAQMRARDEDPGVQGTITLLTDPHETGSSRFDIRPGDNVKVIGHRGDVVLQVSEVSVSDLAVTLTVDSRARDALSVLAILERNREARRDMSSRTARSSNKAGLDNDATVQYESESKAGTVPRTAVNGDSGLWTIVPIFVSQVGVAKVEFLATSPKAEMVIALFEKPITANKLASFVPDPLSSDDGWYDSVETLEESHGLMEIFGTPDQPGGYWPRQKTGSKAGPLTGKMRDRSSALYSSKYGGFVWVAMFTSQSTWVSGRMYPAVPT